MVRVIPRTFRGRPRVPDYQRIHRAIEPRLRGPIPALNVPIENANQTLDKVIYTMNRGGSNARNPMLKGLGTRMVIHVGTLDELLGVWLFRDRANIGNNLVGSVVNLGAGIYGLTHLLGSGLSIAGDKDTGAKKNYLRVQTRGGAFEREFWLKDYEADVIACHGQNALDTETLEPVPIELSTADAGEDGWIDDAIDFFVSWNDEFQKMHNGGSQYLNPGFLKAYGGALFVSFFQTGMDEGEGTEVNPVTQAVISDQHTIQIEGTPGTKHVTVRFRSKQDSPYYVDVPIIFEVTAPTEPDPPICNPPYQQDPWWVYIPPPPPVPPDDPPYTPDTPSTPTDDPNDEPTPTTFHPDPTIPNPPVTSSGRVIVTLDGQKPSGGTAIRVKVLRWKLANDNFVYGGTRPYIFSRKYYGPAITDMDQTGAQGDPYEERQKYTICLDATADGVAQIAFYTVSLYQKNDQGIWKQSEEVSVPGPFCGAGFMNFYLAHPAPPGYGPGSCGGSGFPNIADNGSCPV